MTGARAKKPVSRPIAEILTAGRERTGKPDQRTSEWDQAADAIEQTLGCSEIRCRAAGTGLIEAAAWGRELQDSSVFQLSSGSGEPIACAAVSKTTLMAVVGLQLGGTISASSGRPERAMTSIDCAIAELIVRNMALAASSTKAAIGSLADVENCEWIADTSQLPWARKGGQLLVVSFELQHGGTSTSLQITRPSATLETISMSRSQRHNSGQADAGVEAMIDIDRNRRGIDRAELPLTATMDLGRHSVGAVEQLRVGQLLRLSGRPPFCVTLQANGYALWRGELLRQGSAVVVRLESARGTNASDHSDLKTGRGGLTGGVRRPAGPREPYAMTASEDIASVVEFAQELAEVGEQTGNAPHNPVHAARKDAAIMRIPVELKVVIGTAVMTVAEISALERGTIVTLDRRVGEAVDVVANGHIVARGQVVAVGEDGLMFGVSISEAMNARLD